MEKGKMLNERYDELEEWLKKGNAELVEAIQPGPHLIVADEPNFARDLTDNQLRGLGAFVKVCCRYGATLVFGDSRRWLLPPEHKPSTENTEGKTEGDVPRK